MAERALGDEVPVIYSPRGDWVRSDSSVGKLTPDNLATSQSVRRKCLSYNFAATPSAANTDSNAGQSWFNGTLRISLYNHVAPPNSKGCQASNSINGSTPASSYHPGGVNMLMADGSVRFIRETISADVWSAAGGVKDGIPLTAANL